MNIKMVVAALSLAAPVFAMAADLYGDLPDSKHAWSVHDMNRPKPSRVTPAAKCGGAPSDAVVLFDGTKESFEKNWCDKKGDPSKWSYSDEGYFFTKPGWTNGGNIFTRAKFGDCQLHIEYRHDPNNLYADKGAQMRGNSGVFIMGSYEVQVLESYYTSREECTVDNYTDGQAGSVYAENPPLVNPARKPGEWQVYDITSLANGRFMISSSTSPYGRAKSSFILAASPYSSTASSFRIIGRWRGLPPIAAAALFSRTRRLFPCPFRITAALSSFAISGIVRLLRVGPTPRAARCPPMRPM